MVWKLTQFGNHSHYAFSMWPMFLQTERNSTGTGGSVSAVLSAIVTGVLLMHMWPPCLREMLLSSMATPTHEPLLGFISGTTEKPLINQSSRWKVTWHERHYCQSSTVDWTCTVVLSHLPSLLVPHSLPHNKNGGPKQREQTRVTGCVLGVSRSSPVEKIPNLIFWMPSLDLGLQRWSSFWHLI